MAYAIWAQASGKESFLSCRGVFLRIKYIKLLLGRVNNLFRSLILKHGGPRVGEKRSTGKSSLRKLIRVIFGGCADTKGHLRQSRKYTHP